MTKPIVKHEWTLARQAEAVRLYRSGSTLKEASRQLKTSPERIKSAVVVAGFWRSRKRRPNHKKRWDRDRDVQVADMYLGGMTLMRIARHFGGNPASVARSLERSGTETRGRFAFPAGDKNIAWSGGRMVDKGGYVLICLPQHPDARKSGYILESRLVMEQMIGRRLLRGEVVHHKQLPKSNNDPSNLELYGSNADHLKNELAGRTPNWTNEGWARIKVAHQIWAQMKINRRIEELQQAPLFAFDVDRQPKPEGGLFA
jgi:DNA-binding CsgD family transcriptional regulator